MVKPGTPARHLDKAADFLATAALLLAGGKAERAASDAYVAAFHAAPALLATATLAAETHSAVHANLARHVVREGVLPAGASRTLARLMTDRLLADDGVDQQVDARGGAEALAEAASLIGQILAAVLAAMPAPPEGAERLRGALAALPPPPA
jgi:uncharacterized protein (UPF0332 family)